MNVASDIAFAAVDAAALLGLEFVEMRGFRPKVDRDIRVAELVEAMKLIRDFSHELSFGRQAPARLGDRVNVEHVGDQIVVRIQSRPAIPRRPSLAENRLRRPQMNIGVDQGSATESRALHHRHLLKGFYVEQALPGFPEPSIEGVVPVAGELVDVVTAPSLEY